MERRDALKTFAFAISGMLTIPSWATNWRPEDIPATQFLTSSEKNTLIAVIDTIIPTTDTLGAKDAGVPTYVEAMLADCFEKDAQQNMRTALTELDTQAKTAHGQQFNNLSNTQRLDLLKKWEQSGTSTQKDALGKLKSLTIKGYLLSEYVMTNITKYELVPGRYHGCVDLKIK